MSRGFWFTVCALLGVALVGMGLLVPAHLRAVDARVLQQAGAAKTGLIEERRSCWRASSGWGRTQMFAEAAQAEKMAGAEKLADAVREAGRQHPEALKWGAATGPMPGMTLPEAKPTNSAVEPFTGLVVLLENRGKVLDFLAASRVPAVQELLKCRALTNTAIFPPSSSASGQAFDAAIGVCGLLLEGGQLTPQLRDALSAHAWEANHGGNSQRVEQALLDLMSFGQRFNWGQLADFAGRIEDVETLRLLGDQVRKATRQTPELFSAVLLAGKPAAVAHYLQTYSQTGLTDLGASLRYGAGGVNGLLDSDQRLYSSNLGLANSAALAGLAHFTADLGWRMAWFALMLKWLGYLGGGFLLAAAVHFARPVVSTMERPLQVRGIHLAREILFALGFLVVVLLLSEPFLSQERQKVDVPFRLHLPTVGSVAPTGTGAVQPTTMDNKQQTLTLLTMLLFFVLQGLIYVACLVKLAEIRRQQVVPRIKLKLLENEDHLFDAGLYLGFVGTIISLILVSLGITKLSLMAAYSSTSFGIIFVTVFKIFHLRPARRTLLMQAEAESVRRESAAVPAAASYATTP